jgi:SAM-dependent methyltransferase
MRQSATIMARTIVDSFHPLTVVDVGCGTGHLLVSLRALGVRGIGLERSPTALLACRHRGLDVRKFDLESAENFSEHADIVVSTEVAEHLPAQFADHFIDLLANIARVVILTAATPGQGGTDHVNEQPNGYWIEKFRQRAFRFEERLTHRWRNEWVEKQVTTWYWANLMVFSREGGQRDLA